ncbi:MAG TPA: hypothetical protein VK158_06720 [Acidobacteriota bacterium]|nr:hypothetical protein [Acidobacteriota bacterium]
MVLEGLITQLKDLFFSANAAQVMATLLGLIILLGFLMLRSANKTKA